MNSSSLSAARTPFIRLLIPLLAGILYQEFLCLPIWGNLIPALCGLVLWSSFIKRDSIEEQYHKRNIFGVGLFLIVFSIGAILHGTQNRISQQPSGFYPIAIAHVNDKAVEKTNSYYCPVTITALSDTNGSVVKYKEKIALYFEKGIQARRLEYGDIIGFEFRPKAIPSNTNPYAFDFASFMKHKGISRSQYLTGKQWKYIEEKPKSNLRKATSDLQKHLSDQLQSCNLSKNSTLLLRALLLGERQEFPQDLRSYFSAAGLSHVLAVSGLHMGVVASLIYFLFFPLSLFKSCRKLRPLSTLFVLWIYAYITGLSPSAVRACIMASFLLTAEFLDRRNSSLNALFAAAFFMLSYDTNLIFDVGFQMSFSAVTAILLFYSKLNIGGNSPYFVVRWLSSCVAVSIAAQIGALPIAVYYFHTIPLLFLIGNIFVLPLLPVVFGLSFFLLLLSALHIPYDWLGNTIDFLLQYIQQISLHIYKLPWSHIESVWLEARYLWLYFICGILSYITVKNRSKKTLWLTLGFCIGFLIFDLCTYKSPQPEIIVYDSKKSTVVQLSDKDRCYILLSDTLTSGQRVVGEEYRMKNGKAQYEIFQHGSPGTKDNTGFIDYPFAQFYGKRLVLLGKQEWDKLSIGKKLTIDYVIIGKMFNDRIEDILELFSVRQFIIGPDVHPRRATKLQNDCFENSIPCHDIRTQGAWIHTLDP